MLLLLLHWTTLIGQDMEEHRIPFPPLEFFCSPTFVPPTTDKWSDPMPCSNRNYTHILLLCVLRSARGVLFVIGPIRRRNFSTCNKNCPLQTKRGVENDKQKYQLLICGSEKSNGIPLNSGPVPIKLFRQPNISFVIYLICKWHRMYQNPMGNGWLRVLILSLVCGFCFCKWEFIFPNSSYQSSGNISWSIKDGRMVWRRKFQDCNGKWT